MAYTGTECTCEGASVKIATVELAGGGTTSVKAKRMYEDKPLTVFANYPEPKRTQVREWVEGSIGWIVDKNSDYPTAQSTGVALLIDGDGLYLSCADTEITDVEIEVATEDFVKGSLSFKTHGTFTFNNASA